MVNADLWPLMGKSCLPKMSKIFSKIVLKQCLHACDYLHVWRPQEPCGNFGQNGVYSKYVYYTQFSCKFELQLKNNFPQVGGLFGGASAEMNNKAKLSLNWGFG